MHKEIKFVTIFGKLAEDLGSNVGFCTVTIFLARSWRIFVYISQPINMSFFLCIVSYIIE